MTKPTKHKHVPYVAADLCNARPGENKPMAIAAFKIDHAGLHICGTFSIGDIKDTLALTPLEVGV